MEIGLFIKRKGNVLIRNVIVILKNYYLNWIFCELRLNNNWIGINGNWIWNLIKNMVDWNVNVLIIIIR